MDLPFSLTFYRWLLGEEHTLTLADLIYVCPDIHRTLTKLQEVVRRKEIMEKDQSLRMTERAQRIEALDLDGCPISELGLVFELPGYENIELRKGGSDIPVTIHNLDQYIKVFIVGKTEKQQQQKNKTSFLFYFFSFSSILKIE